MDNKPKVSILMPVYNNAEYLKEAIDSILNQTYRDYEFIIINDGSKDNSVAIIQSYRDDRIRLINNETNVGLPSILNKWIELARGEYIVRMDADDISLPARIEKQVSFMDNHPEVGVCGSWIKYIGISRWPWRSTIYKYPITPRYIKAKSLFVSSLCHPSVIMRKSLLEKFQLRYDPGDFFAEDYGLWQKCSFCFSLANIPEVLLLYRITSGSMTRSERGLTAAHRIIRLNIQNLGIEFTPEELLICRSYSIHFAKDSLIKFHSWLQKLQKANAIKQIYPEPEFAQVLSEEWFSACYRGYRLGIKVWFLFWQKPLSRIAKFNIKQIIKFFLKTTGIRRLLRNE